MASKGEIISRRKKLKKIMVDNRDNPLTFKEVFNLCNSDDFIKELWELNMYKSQKTSMVDLKEEIDKGLLGIQLKQIDIDILNCINSMNKQTGDYEDIYHRYQQLIRERNRMISDTE